jgi:hypothetical protein
MFLGIPDPLVRGMDLDPHRFFHRQSKIVRKPFISIVLQLLSDFLSLKNDVNISLKTTVICKKDLKNTLFFVAVLKKSRIRIRTKMSRIQNTGSNCTAT